MGTRTYTVYCFDIGGGRTMETSDPHTAEWINGLLARIEALESQFVQVSTNATSFTEELLGKHLKAIIAVDRPTGGPSPAAHDGGQSSPMESAAASPKPPAQTVSAGMGDTSAVQSPKAPPAGFLRMANLASHPWFQEYVDKIEHPAYLRARAMGDSLSLARLYLGAQVLVDGTSWGDNQDKRLAKVVSDFEAWCAAKGYELDD